MKAGPGFWSALFASPATYLVLLVTAAMEAAFVTWFQPPLPILGLALLAGVMLLALWPPLFATSAGWQAAREQARARISEATVARIQALEADLRRLGAEQAVAQLRGLREKLQNLTGVIERRLNAGELAFGRYLGTAEQVYLSAIDNLHEVAVALTSVGAVDLEYIARRKAELSAQPAAGSGERERASLDARARVFEAQHEKVAALLADNEAAMTALTNTAAALADVKTSRGHADLDATAAMQALESLAARAPSYAASGTTPHGAATDGAAPRRAKTEN